MLNGQGPDETFAGYLRHLGAAYGQTLSVLPAPFARSVLTPLLEHLPAPLPYRRLAYSLCERSEVDRFCRSTPSFRRGPARES